MKIPRHTPNNWSQLILPLAQKDTLQAILQRVNTLKTKATSALFYGSSGTGKTMAAELLAKELEAPLFNVNLKQVVHKYIGETEKNLARLFSAAQDKGWILFFDEADALFGKRTSVQDAHDRLANQEVSYLLERIAKHPGLVILKSNKECNPTLLRKIHFTVHFPNPDKDLRNKLWKQMLKQHKSTVHLTSDKIEQLPLTGGNIQRITTELSSLAKDHTVHQNDLIRLTIIEIKRMGIRLTPEQMMLLKISS